MKIRLGGKWLLLACSWIVAAPLTLPGCSASGVATDDASITETSNRDTASPSSAITTAGLELQGEDYKVARSHFQTKLTRQAPAPQEGESLGAPVGASQVAYSTDPPLKAWVSRLPAVKGKTSKYPAVLFLHGGFAMGASDWDMAKPYREAGFIVMMPALRGENGQSGSYSMFYNEVKDVLAAGEYLAKQPAVDAKHIYLAGHSVGGTLVLLSAMTSNRFNAAASFSGSPDQIAWSKGQSEVIPFDKSDQKEYQMRSPLAYATSFKCPTRMYYGDTEAWCDASSQRVASLAKEKKLDVEAVRVPGDHFSEVPAAIKQSIEFFRSQ
jgi:dipeptidyl aminopeptidase/acylaminoacyl peptidase